MRDRALDELLKQLDHEDHSLQLQLQLALAAALALSVLALASAWLG